MTVYLVDIEAVDTRYTKQWKEHLPAQMRKAGLDVVVITGGEVPQATTPGAFLNFAGTNNYKSQQMLEISRMFAMGDIKDGDYFLYTDAWNPTVIQLRYMAELLRIKVKIGGMWHAGSYDPQDFLGRLIGNAPWVRRAEASMFSCYDHNFFATRFHVDLIAEELFGINPTTWDFEFGETPADILIQSNSTVKIVGWPMEYLRDTMAPYANTKKKNKIIFPHRVAPEKQVEIFRDLAKELPQYEWFVAQDQTLTKHEYHTHMAESRLMFSASLQETLGIGAYEAALVGTLPVIPHRLSYTEMWETAGMYPSDWTSSWESYQKNKSRLVAFIRNRMDETNVDIIESAKESAYVTGSRFFDGQALYDAISSTLNS